MDPVSGLFPILEFDEAEAILEPASTQARLDVPASAVACFFPGLIDELLGTHVNMGCTSIVAFGVRRRRLSFCAQLHPSGKSRLWSGKHGPAMAFSEPPEANWNSEFTKVGSPWK